MSLTEKQKMEAYLGRELTEEEFEKEKYLLMLGQKVRERERAETKRFNIIMSCVVAIVVILSVATIVLA